MNDHIATKLRRIRIELGEKQSQIARRVGVSQQAWANYETGIRLPPVKVLRGLRMSFGINLNWLLTDDGPMMNRSISVRRVEGDHEFEIPEDDLDVPILGRTLMGGEDEPVKLDTLGSYGDFFRDWLEGKAFTNPEQAFISEVDNLAMLGLLDDGDLVIAERCTVIGKKGIYVFWRAGNIEVWHVDAVDNKLMLVPHYQGVQPEPLVLSPDCKVIGKVKAAVMRVLPMQEKWKPPA